MMNFKMIKYQQYLLLNFDYCLSFIFYNWILTVLKTIWKDHEIYLKVFLSRHWRVIYTWKFKEQNINITVN